MSIKTLVAAALDGAAPPIGGANSLPDPFRSFLSSIRLASGSKSRVASRILRMGFGATPCKKAVAQLIKLDLMWIAEKWCTMYSDFTGDSGVGLTDLLPAPEVEKPTKLQAAPKPPKPQLLPMPEGKKYIGVLKTQSGLWMAQISIGNKVRQLCRSHDPYVCAVAYDVAAKANPSTRKKRKLNFFIDDPLACTPEPNKFVLKEVAA